MDKDNNTNADSNNNSNDNNSNSNSNNNSSNSNKTTPTFSIAACKNENCKSKDTCKRYILDWTVANFDYYYYDNEKGKCKFYIKKR